MKKQKYKYVFWIFINGDIKVTDSLECNLKDAATLAKQAMRDNPEINTLWFSPLKSEGDLPNRAMKMGSKVYSLTREIYNLFCS